MRDQTPEQLSFWKPVRLLPFIAVTSFTVLIVFLANTGQRWVPLLDGANLMFHEAGHPILGLFSARLMVYGGTLGQLAFPMITISYFAKRKESIATYLCFIWLMQNFFNIARYMADARAQVLPLVGGGEHDWTEIFNRFNCLASDTQIAGKLTFFAFAGCAVGWWYLMKQSLAGRQHEGR